MAKSKDEQVLKIRNKGRRNKNVEFHGGVTRQDIADLLESIGKPGQKRKDKIEAVAELKLQNSEGVGVEQDLNSYREF